jgi:hypothetical protein
VNYAVAAIYVIEKKWPDTGSIMMLADLTPDQQQALAAEERDTDFGYFLGSEN